MINFKRGKKIKLKKNLKEGKDYSTPSLWTTKYTKEMFRPGTTHEITKVIKKTNGISYELDHDKRFSYTESMMDIEETKKLNQKK